MGIRVWAAMMAMALAAAACSSGDGDAGGNATLQCKGTSKPAVACCDVANQLVDACIRCGIASDSECVQAIESQIDLSSFGQGCEGADQIRDETELYGKCLPSIQKADCGELKAGNTDPSCHDQIIYKI